jgi:hypothetical protein
VADTAAIYRDRMAAETAVAHCVAKAVTSAAKTTAMASAMASSAVASAASCERGCADRRCRYAEREGRSRCNYLFAHFSKLLMFHLKCAVWMRFCQWTAETQAHKIAPSRRMGETFIRSSTSIKASSTD